MNKRKFVAGVSIMTVAMAMGSPAMEAFAAETAVQFSGDEWDGHPEITQVNKRQELLSSHLSLWKQQKL